MSKQNTRDLRHTAATPFSVPFNGNLHVLKLILGHKTDSQVLRYVNAKPDDGVRMMLGRPLADDEAPPGDVPTESEKMAADIETAEVPVVLPVDGAQVAFCRGAA